MNRVLITGASGFLGRHCLAFLARRAAEVHAVIRSGACEVPVGTHTHAVDLLDPVQVETLLAKVRPSHLLHLAWITTPGTYWTTPENVRWVEASLHLLRMFAEHGGRRVVMAGSCAEYDWSAGRCLETATRLLPATLYGVCKNALRAVLEAFAARANLSAAWGRVFFLYGPHEHPRRLVPSVVRALLAGEPALCSSGIQERDFLHVADAAEAFVELLQSQVCGAVNIASGEAVTVGTVVRRLADLLGRPNLVRLGALPLAESEPPLLVADVSRLREELKWSPRFDLGQGLAHTIDWWRTRFDATHSPS
jgi:nucleoside-diphosphate-sugar epimerase